MAAKNRKKQKKGGGLVLNSVSALLICAVLVLGVSVFFRVSDIEVRGASRYSTKDIIEASGIKEGTNLVFLNRAAVEEAVREKLVYVGAVRVSRRLPNTVVIEVSEGAIAAVVETDSGLWLIDNYCRLLEPCSLAEAENYVKISGFVALSPKVGQRLKLSEQERFKVDYLEALLGALLDADMLKDVGGIDMEAGNNPQLSYLGRFRVKLGKNDNIASKLAVLAGAIEKLGPNSHGTFDLSDAKKASFSPD